MPALYTLRATNESPLAGNICLFQRDPQQETEEDVFSLAWLCQPCQPGGSLTFSWKQDYGFAWSDTGPLSPGVIFRPRDLVSADPSGLGRPSVSFGRHEDGFCFVEGHNPSDGCLNFNTDSSVPVRSISVALTINGLPAFARPAGPDMAFTFQPHPEFWITFGPYGPGEVLDARQVMDGGVRLDLNDRKLSAGAVFQRDCAWLLR